MANPGLATLGSLRLQAKFKADKVNSQYITDAEWNQYLTNSYKELYDLLIGAYGNDYFIAPPFAFQTVSSQYLYPLPDGYNVTDMNGVVQPALYKLIGVDLQVTTDPNSNITMRKFEWNERNKFWLANQYAVYGITTLRYRLNGNNIWLTPVPVPVQTIRLWYIPKPTNLMYTVIGSTTANSTTITMSDTSAIGVGDTIQSAVTGVLPTGTTVVSITKNTSIVVSAAATATSTNTQFLDWNDNTTLDGISGWEEYLIVDSAMKGLLKERKPVDELMADKMDLRQRIESMAESRDAGMTPRVSDTQSTEYGYPGWSWTGFGSGGDW